VDETGKNGWGGKGKNGLMLCVVGEREGKRGFI
jgi:hypothetical protein